MTDGFTEIAPWSALVGLRATHHQKSAVNLESVLKFVRMSQCFLIY